MLIDAPSTLLNTIIHKKHLSHFMAKTMNELAHKSPLIVFKMAENGLFSGISSANNKETKQSMAFFSSRNVLNRYKFSKFIETG